MGIDSQAWTGRGHYWPTPVGYVKRWINRVLYPSYECECCVGQDASQGCYCAFYGAVAPSIGPEPWRAWLRSVFRRAALEATDHE